MNIWKRYSMRVSKNWVKFNKMFTLSPWGEYLSNHKLFNAGMNALSDKALRLENLTQPALLEG